jgi:wobble nucleotide-excising tRNase
MLVRFAQVVRLGRLTGIDHGSADELKFRRLTLLYGRNATGKSTLARLLQSASTHDVSTLMADRTLGESDPPRLTLVYGDRGHTRFDNNGWTGRAPRVLVFNREFIEANVAVGRKPDKRTRKGFLELALGEEDVDAKRRLDEAVQSLKSLNSEARPHEATIQTAASSAGMGVTEFNSLEEPADAETQRNRLAAAEREASTAVEVLRRPSFSVVQPVPVLHWEGLRDTLNASVEKIGDEAEALVRRHLADQLGGRGDNWVRQGMNLDDGCICPYCGQPTDAVELLRHYRGYFDDGWDKLAKEVEALSATLEPFSVWWSGISRTIDNNERAASAWHDLDGLQVPPLDKERIERSIDDAKVALDNLLAQKRASIGSAVESATVVACIRRLLTDVEASISSYNHAVEAAQNLVAARRSDLEQLSMEAVRGEISRLEACVLRHSDLVAAASGELERIAVARLVAEEEKAEALQELETRSEEALRTFMNRINERLEALCVDFRIEQLGTERTGGSPAAKFTLVVQLAHADHRRLSVANPSGEERFAQILSEGDRSTLALAIFLSSLEDVEDLDEHIIVFDDPVTSLDVFRSEATAVQVADTARTAHQVLVLSHHAPFLAQLSHQWTRHGGEGAAHDLREVELERGTRKIVPWKSEDHVANEHILRWRELHQFVHDQGRDPDSRHIHGEIRSFLEGYVRLRWPDIFNGQLEPLESVIRRMRADPALREQKTSLTAAQLEQLDRMCAFGAPGNHTGVHRGLPAPDPQAVRVQARRALEFCR